MFRAGGMVDPNFAMEEELDLNAIKMEVVIESARSNPGAKWHLPQVHHQWGFIAVDPKDLNDNHEIIVQNIMEGTTREPGPSRRQDSLGDEVAEFQKKGLPHTRAGPRTGRLRIDTACKLSSTRRWSIKSS